MSAWPWVSTQAPWKTSNRPVELQPQSPKLLLLLANAQAAGKRYDAAADSLDRALGLQPDYLPAQVALGRLKLRTDNPAEALEIARQIQQQHPQTSQGHLLEGDIHLPAKEYGKAAQSYAAGYDRQKTAELAIKLFQARSQGGDEGSARAPLEDWIAQRPEDLRVRQVLAQAYLALQISLVPPSSSTRRWWSSNPRISWR